MTDLALVTGASGFVGSALCQALLDSGVRVRALHRTSSDLSNLKELAVEYCEGDILDRQSMDRACHQARWVYHAASQSAYWRNPRSVKQTAINGTRNVAEAALDAGVERLIFTSSLAAMGIPLGAELLTEQHHFNLPEVLFPYGAAKHQAEQVIQQSVAQGLDAVIVNPTIILGPGDINQISGSMVVEAARGWSFFYTDGGANYVHILDVAEGHLAAARLGKKGARYIVGGENVSYKEAFTRLSELVGRKRPWLKIPNWIIPPAAKLMELLPPGTNLPFDKSQLLLSRHHLYCDIQPARDALELNPPRSFRQAAEDTYRWYQEQGMLNKASS